MLRWIHALARVRFDEDGTPRSMVGTYRDVTAEKEAEAAEALLAGELRHRIQNLFAVTQAAIGASGREADTAAGAARLARSRVAALGRAHERSIGREGDDLEALVTAILGAFAPGRLRVEGPPVAVPSGALTPLGLILHELATNATKHGALSVEAGRIAVTWDPPEAGRLRLRWAETGGPDAARGDAGFGSALLDGAARQLDGAIVREDGRGGLVARLDLRLSPGGPNGG